MASNHSWPALRIPPLPGESGAHYEWRRAEIEAIVTGFRWGRFSGRDAERLEKRLMRLRGL